MKCPKPKCDANVREHEANCPACYQFVGHPNVRAAQKTDEQRALAQRLKRAEATAAARGAGDVLAAFRRAVQGSQAVLCRSLSQVMALVSSDSAMYASFYDLVGAGIRRPEDSEVDRERLQADALLFPHYQKEIRFLALSLNGRGATSYGRCSVVLKDLAIRDRATVFEGNSLDFCKNNGFRRPLPLGCKATWDKRDELAAAKLEPLLQPHMRDQQFAEILLRPSDEAYGEDFMEVHIYGSLHRQSIERIVVRESSHPPHIAHLLDIKRIVREAKMGATMETYK